KTNELDDDNDHDHDEATLIFDSGRNTAAASTTATTEAVIERADSGQVNRSSHTSIEESGTPLDLAKRSTTTEPVAVFTGSLNPGTASSLIASSLEPPVFRSVDPIGTSPISP